MIKKVLKNLLSNGNNKKYSEPLEIDYDMVQRNMQEQNDKERLEQNLKKRICQERGNYEEFLEKDFFDRSDRKMTLLNLKQKKEDNGSKRIFYRMYAFSAEGQEGEFCYEIEECEYSNIALNIKEGERVLHIIHLYSNEDCRRRGIGSNALTFIEMIAKKNNIHKIIGEITGDMKLKQIDEELKRKISFYQKNGYEIVGNYIVKEI